MSRPFSYNDENFTVIGNMLFGHIKVPKGTSVNIRQKIVEAPPELFKRMASFANYAIPSKADTGGIPPKTLGLYVDKDNGIPYFYSTDSYNPGSYYDGYLYFNYYLKRHLRR